MKKGERLCSTRTILSLSPYTSIFYNNSIISTYIFNKGLHTANDRIGEQYSMLRSTFRHVKVCVPLITNYVEELRT